MELALGKRCDRAPSGIEDGRGTPEPAGICHPSGSRRLEIIQFPSCPSTEGVLDQLLGCQQRLVRPGIFRLAIFAGRPPPRMLKTKETLTDLAETRVDDRAGAIDGLDRHGEQVAWATTPLAAPLAVALTAFVQLRCIVWTTHGLNHDPSGGAAPSRPCTDGFRCGDRWT